MRMYEELLDMLEREVKEITDKGTLDEKSLDHLYKIMLSIKAADKHMEMHSHGANNGVYSNRSYGRSYDDRSYDPYSRDNFRYSTDRGSYDYSGDSMKRKLEKMMSEASNESDRMAIMECMSKLK